MSAAAQGQAGTTDTIIGRSSTLTRAELERLALAYEDRAAEGCFSRSLRPLRDAREAARRAAWESGRTRGREDARRAIPPNVQGAARAAVQDVLHASIVADALDAGQYDLLTRSWRAVASPTSSTDA